MNSGASRQGAASEGHRSERESTLNRSQPDWQAIADGITFRTQAFVHGAFRDARDGATRPTIDPASGRELAQVAECGPADVDTAVSSARDAFKSGVWSRAGSARRKDVLLRLADLILANSDELAVTDSLDMGKLVTDAASIDVPGSAAILRYYAEAIDKLAGEVPDTPPGNVAFVERVPLGVVAAIVPWNYPLEMAIWKLAPALAAGNSVVLKPAEQSPLSALRLAELAAEAGLPDGVLNVLPGSGPTAGQAIGRHPDVDAVAFTGSSAIGLKFLEYAGQSNLKQVWPECGGKSPNVVFADIDDLEDAAGYAARGIFFNQGEVCSANSRLLVQRDILGPFVDAVVERAKAITVGHPFDPQAGMGPLVDRDHADQVERYVAEGVRTGRLLTGGQRMTVQGSDCYFEPTIVTDLPAGSAILREEIFGPVLAVIPFCTEDEAIAIANDTPYGLAASVWTGSLSRAHRVASRLAAGTVSVNTVDALGPTTPFGGFKSSGFGRDLSLHALDKYTGLKTTWIRYSAG
jgi:gamma-glutamyl-gamma-aminobutyraldehyde dehydrogenase